MSSKSLIARLALPAVFALVAIPGWAGVIRIDASAFHPDAGIITFSEFPLGTVNPTYPAASYGGGVGAPTVTFGGFFAGQSLSLTPAVDCPGGAATGCVVGTPSSTLAFDGLSPNTFIVNDGANPTSPVLSGSPTFNGPVSIIFSTGIAGVGLDGGFFNAANSTAIRAFDRNGNLLGQVTNLGLGIEFLGLVTDDGSNSIAGLQFSLVGAEPAGFAIDNLRFGTADQVSAAPEPGTVAMILSGLGAVVLGRRRIKTRG